MSALKAICAIGLYLSACEILEFVVVRKRAADAFPPKVGWRMLRWIFIAFALATIGQRLYGRQPEPSDATSLGGSLFLVRWGDLATHCAG